MEVSGHFIPFRGGANGPAGLLLAINPNSVSHISSVWSKEFKQSMLRLHLNNGRLVSVFEPDVAGVLEKLGLDEFVEDWVFSLEKDIG
jgi:transposase-like protein